MNESFDQAMDKLLKYHYVIISGIPGIGKTTLARQLIFHKLATDYDDFICSCRIRPSAINVFLR